MKSLVKLSYFISILPFVVFGVVLGLGLTGVVIGWKLSFQILEWLSQK